MDRKEHGDGKSGLPNSAVGVAVRKDSRTVRLKFICA